MASDPSASSSSTFSPAATHGNQHPSAIPPSTPTSRTSSVPPHHYPDFRRSQRSVSPHLGVEGKRLTVSEMKRSAKRIDSFYSGDVVFEGSMARCTWELGVDSGSDARESQQAEVVEAPKTNASVSRWSSDSKSDPPWSLPCIPPRRSWVETICFE